MYRFWILLGGLAGLSGVGMAAAVAHGFGPRLGPAAMALAQTGIQMQMWHALALLLCGIRLERGGRGHWAAGAFSLGIILFSGGLYLRALGGPRLSAFVPAGIVPAGGMLLLLGWLLLTLSALRRR